MIRSPFITNSAHHRLRAMVLFLDFPFRLAAVDLCLPGCPCAPLSAEGVAISILSPPPPFFCLLSFCFRSDFFFLLAGEGSIYPEPVAFYFPLSIPGILLSAHCSILPLEGNGVKGRVPPGTGQHGRPLASPMLSQGSRHGYIQSPASSSFTLQRLPLCKNLGPNFRDLA